MAPFYALTSSNFQFDEVKAKLFHCQNQEKICNNIITKGPPSLKCVATLPCEMSGASVRIRC